MFRSNEDDSNISVVDTVAGDIHLCTEVSPVLRGVEFESIHRLRYYADKQIKDEVTKELRKVVKKYGNIK